MAPSSLVGFDIGGSSIKAARFDPSGKLLREASSPTRPEKGPQAAVAAMKELLQRVLPAESRRTVSRIGVGVPGLLDRERGKLLLAPNLHGWKRFPLKSRLEKTFRLPVVLENDANCAALGERWKGAAEGERNFLFITLGTGIGGGLFLGGKLWRGEHGMAGEFGHICVDPKGPRCGCGATGCLETIASATGIWRSAREAGLSFSTIEEVFDAARRGESKGRLAVERAGRALGRAIASAVQLLDLRLFVVGGGVSASLRFLLPYLKAELTPRIYGRKKSQIRVIRSRLGARAGLYGAAFLAR